MRSLRLLILPIVLPAAFWGCSTEPHDGASVRLEGRGVLLGAPPELPPDPGMRPCRQKDHAAVELVGTADSQTPHPLSRGPA